MRKSGGSEAMTKNGWGLIGTGRIAEDRILPGITAHPGNTLVAVVSRDQARAAAFAKKFGARHAYTHYDDMLRNPEVTAVAIHTPNAQHAAQAVAAARAGKHVFCDKPMATTVADAERIVRECEKAGITLGINFHNRFMPCFIETRRIIASGEIGEVHLVQLEASPGARSGGRLATWRVDRRGASIPHSRASALLTVSVCTSTTSCAICWLPRSRWYRRFLIRRRGSWRRPMCPCSALRTAPSPN
jgi:1,5-anhydro-D-fructose reductase (1,5-anhydro-D-mannitol-forming)